MTDEDLTEDEENELYEALRYLVDEGFVEIEQQEDGEFVFFKAGDPEHLDIEI